MSGVSGLGNATCQALENIANGNHDATEKRDEVLLKTEALLHADDVLGPLAVDALKNQIAAHNLAVAVSEVIYKWDNPGKTPSREEIGACKSQAVTQELMGAARAKFENMSMPDIVKAMSAKSAEPGSSAEDFNKLAAELQSSTQEISTTTDDLKTGGSQTRVGE